jgi:hypothetical protein
VITERPSFSEELNVARVEDVVAAGDEDFFHIDKKVRMYPKEFVASN